MYSHKNAINVFSSHETRIFLSISLKIVKKENHGACTCERLKELFLSNSIIILEFYFLVIYFFSNVVLGFITFMIFNFAKITKRNTTMFPKRLCIVLAHLVEGKMDSNYTKIKRTLVPFK